MKSMTSLKTYARTEIIESLSRSFMMAANINKRSWQDDLVARYPRFFVREIHGRAAAPGYPEVGDGWRDLVETAVARVAAAVESLDGHSLKIGQIKQKFGALRRRHRRVWLPALAAAAATVAIIAVSVWVRTGTDTSVLGATLAFVIARKIGRTRSSQVCAFPEPTL